MGRLTHANTPRLVALFAMFLIGPALVALCALCRADEPVAKPRLNTDVAAPSKAKPPAPPAADVKPPPPASASLPEKPPSAPIAPIPLERGDLEAFFDGALGLQLEERHIAGAVVAVTVGDKVVFQKGYGYADVDKRQRVDPETTMFRVGSITKTFTWTAVMQLVEQGKLDLNTDVNKYLKDFQVPATFSQPVTLKDCMTHTPGFEDSVIGLFAHKADAVKPLAQVLHEQFPTRVRPPGVLASYSNHATALSGLVVASVAGKSWEEYVEDAILKPLGMQHTLVRQPAKDKLPANMSKGYKWEGGRFKEVGFEYIADAPAGTMAASAGAKRYVEVEPLVFQQLDGTRRLVFRADEKGNITHLFPAYAAAVAFEHHEWYQRLDFQMLLLAVTAALFASALVIWPVIAFSIRGLAAPTIRRTRVSALASLIGFLLSATCLAVLVGILIGLQEPDEIAFGTPPTLKWVLAIPQVCVALTALALIFCLVAWKQAYWRFSGRLHYTLVTLAGVGFCWFTYYWNLLHFGAVSV
jgi:CubicO group peptidase (beta-lactamase class C family)